MNNTFDIKRFGMLFKKHTLEHGKTYVLSTGVLAGLLFLLLWFFAYTTDGHLSFGVQIPTFIFMMLISGSIFTSIVFNDLGDKSKAIPSLMLPASHFEKYLVAWIYSYIIFQVIYVGLFYLTGSLVIITSSGQVENNKMINIFTTENDCWYAFVAYGLCHAFAFYGAVFFKKIHFIKTAIAFFICGIALTLVNKPIMSSLIGEDVVKILPFQSIWINQHEHYIRISSTDGMTNTFLGVLALVVLLLWITTYFRLKEKEV